MHYDIEQAIQAPLGAVMAAYCDAAFYDAMGETPGLGRPVLLERTEGIGGPGSGKVRIRVRFAYTGQLSPVARALLDPAKLTWVTDTVVNPAAATLEFVVVPDYYPDRLVASGRDRFLARVDSTVRLATGEVRVRFPLVGPSAERGIVDSYRSHIASEASLLERWAG